MKRVLFVCVENAGRSQMAEAFFRKHAPDKFASSAGTKPGPAVNPVVAQAMKEIGINIENQAPKPLSSDMLEDSVVAVNMGCMDKESCPALFVKNVLDWNIPDPKGKTIDEVRKIRDQIELKVKDLIKSLED